MLILTIVLAAFAPLMTKRRTVDLSSPWRYATNNSDIYYGLGAKQSAMIGQNSKASGDLDSRLIINTSDDSQAHILLKSSKGSPYGILYAYQDNLLLGGSGISMPSFSTHTQSGSGNTSVGYNAMYKNSSSGNTAIGNEALMNNSSGEGNTAIGASALMNTTGSFNVAAGCGALNLGTGSDNTAIGYKAARKITSGNYNTFVGSKIAPNIESGNSNTGLGYWNLLYLENGSYNTALGMRACARVTGSNKTCIGANSGPDSTTSIEASDSEERIYIGGKAKFNDRPAIIEAHNTSSNPTVVVNANLVVNGVIYGNAEVLAGYRLYADGYNGNGSFRHAKEDGNDTRNLTNFPWIKTYSDRWSDKRLKDIKGESKAGLDQIRQLKVYDYTFKKDKENKSQVGVIAQDLQKVFPEAVREGLGGYLMIRQDDMFYAMINSIKQLDKLVQGLINEVKTIILKLKDYDTEIKKLQKENEKLINENEQIKKQLSDITKRLEQLENK